MLSCPLRCQWTSRCQNWRTSHPRYQATSSDVCQFKFYLCWKVSCITVPKRGTCFTPCSVYCRANHSCIFYFIFYTDQNSLIHDKYCIEFICDGFLFLQSIFLLRLKKHNVDLNWLSYSVPPLNVILNSFLNLVILPCSTPIYTALFIFGYI